jgi:hypothetical protein
MLPATFERVPRNTAREVNRRIRQEALANLRRYRNAGPDAVRRRLDELDREWDIERAIEANAAVVALAGVALGAFVHRRFLVLPAAVGLFLLQHSLQGWSPPVPILRRLGFRTAREIFGERLALKSQLR